MRASHLVRDHGRASDAGAEALRFLGDATPAVLCELAAQRPQWARGRLDGRAIVRLGEGGQAMAGNAPLRMRLPVDIPLPLRQRPTGPRRRGRQGTILPTQQCGCTVARSREGWGAQRCTV
jgi:hypothetical protein